MSPTTDAAAADVARPMIYLGMDVHKDSITIAVLPASAKAPTRLDRLPNDLPKLKKWLDRVARDGALRACDEGSGAGYVLHRALAEWGYACDVIAPSLIPQRPGVQRKHDKRDAADLARLYRAGALTVVRIPSEAEESVRDVVRCRETFQHEILKSRPYILKFLARRGFVFREGTNWCTPHLRWLQHLTTDDSPLAPHDRLVFREYHALLLYKLQRREALDRQIEPLALLPALAPMVGRLQCFRGISLHAAMVLATEIVDWRRFARPSQRPYPAQLPALEYPGHFAVKMVTNGAPSASRRRCSSWRTRSSTTTWVSRRRTTGSGRSTSAPCCWGRSTNGP